MVELRGVMVWIDVDFLFQQIFEDLSCGEDFEYDVVFGELECVSCGKFEYVMGDIVVLVEDVDWKEVQDFVV